MLNVDQKLSSFAKSEDWKVLKREMESMARRYYDWGDENDKLEINKGANLFLRDIIRKVEGALDPLD